MPRAIWNGQVIAQSDKTQMVDGNHYFPPDSVNRDFFHDSDHHTVCGWKGTASYFDISVDGKINQQAAWYYPDPKEAAGSIRDRIAFWKGVEVQA